MQVLHIVSSTLDALNSGENQETCKQSKIKACLVATLRGDVILRGGHSKKAPLESIPCPSVPSFSPM